VTLDLDWTGLDNYHTGDVYMNLRFDYAGQTRWINKTVTDTDTEIVIDLNDFSNSKYGPVMWVSNNQTVTTVPQVNIWLSKEDPTQLTDMVSKVRNMLYYDMFYVKMEMEDDFVSRYLSRQTDKEAEARRMKTFMFVLGATMTTVGALSANPGMAIWGLDLCVATTTDKSLFDHLGQEMLRLRGYNESYVEQWHFMQMFGDKGLNLFATELVAEIMSMGVNHISGSLASRLLTGRLKNLGKGFARNWLTKMAGRSIGANFAKELFSKIGVNEIAEIGVDRIGDSFRLMDVFSKFSLPSGNQFTKRMLVAAALRTSVREYLELCLEVITEFAFDNFMSDARIMNFFGLDVDVHRPFGGSELVFGIMITMTIVGGMDGSSDGIELNSRSRSGKIGYAIMLGQLTVMSPMLYGNSQLMNMAEA
jgi:hypothetical protein